MRPPSSASPEPERWTAVSEPGLEDGGRAPWGPGLYLTTWCAHRIPDLQQGIPRSSHEGGCATWPPSCSHDVFMVVAVLPGVQGFT